MSRNPSEIQILYDGSDDITRYVLYSQTTFQTVGSASPGQATITLKDEDRTLDFVIGRKVELIIDGVKLWGGLVMDIQRTNFFPAVDTTDLTKVKTRQWKLICSDYNIYFDKLYLRNPLNYFDANFLGPGTLGSIVTESAWRFFDIPDGLDVNTMVEDTNYKSDSQDGTYMLHPQGTVWRDQMQDFSDRAGAGFPYYIDAYMRLNFHDYANIISPWGFVDRFPDGTKNIGFRDATITEEGMQMVTDALVWGGMPATTDPKSGTVVFARYPQAPAQDRNGPDGQDGKPIILPKEDEQDALDSQALYGIWQRAENHNGETAYFHTVDVLRRAYDIVAGPTGTNIRDQVQGGLERPVWQITLTWFAHDVPGHQYIHPDYLVDLTFYTMNLGISLPLRQVNIDFPTLPPTNPGDTPLTYVRFTGTFGITYADTRYLWELLMKRRRELTGKSGIASTITNVLPTGDAVEAVIARAWSMIGVPYQLGAESTTATDCSGLIYRIFMDSGYGDIIGNARRKAAGYTRYFADMNRFSSSESSAQRGDLIVYGHTSVTHIGIYLGGNEVISALTTTGVTKHRIHGIDVPVYGVLMPPYPADTRSSSDTTSASETDPESPSTPTETLPSQEQFSSNFGDIGTFEPVEQPDGVRTIFTIPVPYLTGTTEVYVNGLLWRAGKEYTESQPALGQLTFGTAPYSDDAIYIVCRTSVS